MRRSLLRTAVLILLPLGLFLVSWPQVRFTYNYILGNYQYYFRNDVGRATQHYSRLFKNPNMAKEENLMVMRNAYGYGVISMHAETGTPLAAEDLKRLQRYYPDNIYLNFLSSKESDGAKVENLDPVAFACLQEPKLNDFSLKVLGHYCNHGKLAAEWLGRLIRFLDWRGNSALADDLRARHAGVSVKAGNAYRPPSRWPAQQILRGGLQNKMEYARAMLSRYVERQPRMSEVVRNELSAHRGYLALRKQLLKLSNRVREMKKTYKMGYPPLAEAAAQTRELERRIKEMTDERREDLRSEIAEGIRTFRELSNAFGKAVAGRPGIRSIPRIVDVQAMPSDNAMAREFSGPPAWNQTQVSLVDFADSSSQDDYRWYVRANRKPYGRGSYFGVREKGHFRIMGFFEQHDHGQTRPWAGLYTRKRVETTPGVFQVTLVYKTRPQAACPILWVGKGVPVRKLPLTMDRWLTVTWWLSFSTETRVHWIRPMLRTAGVGETWINGLWVHKVSDQPFQYLKELMIVSEAQR